MEGIVEWESERTENIDGLRFQLRGQPLLRTSLSPQLLLDSRQVSDLISDCIQTVFGDLLRAGMDLFGSGSCGWWMGFLPSVSLLFVILLLYIVYKIKTTVDYVKSRGFATMPFGKSVALTANLLTLRITPVDFVDTMYRLLDGHKIGGCYQLGSFNLIVRDPELTNRILIKDFSYFHDHGFEVDTDVNPLEAHLFNMNGQKWRALRNKLTPTFTTGKLKGMLQQMSHSSDKLIDILREFKPQDDIPMQDFASRFAMDVIGSCAFGIEAGALKDPDCEFRRMVNRFSRPNFVTKWRMMIRSMFPELALKLKMKTMDSRVTDYFMGITREAFEHRIKTGLRRKDFVDLLLQLKLKGSVDCDPAELTEEDTNISPGVGSVKADEDTDKLVLTDGLLAAQSFIFLAGGLENTASTIGFTLYFLGKHRDVQEKARREVKEMKSKHGGQLTYDALRDMIYLDACISETLRLYPPSAGLLHACTKDYTLEDGRVIDKGIKIIVPVWSIHRDPAYFQEPEEFRPERFMPGHQTHHSNAYIPFGDGPRMCIARRFVLLEVKQVVSNMLDNFKLTLSPKMEEPIKLKRSITILEPEGGFWFRLEPLKETTS